MTEEKAMKLMKFLSDEKKEAIAAIALEEAKPVEEQSDATILAMSARYLILNEVYSVIVF